ncbi:MAG: tryptophan synthase subunit alpha [Methylococcales bacterium]
MSRLNDTFERLAKSSRKALIPFITAGDPNPEFTVPMMHAMVEAGVDIIELGIPFSDPMADGPVIQKASERALKHNTSLTKVLAMVAQFRDKDSDTPVVLMGYLNPIECMGYQTFVESAKEAGVDGVLTVDLPPEECFDITELFEQAGLDLIFLLAPNSMDERIKSVSAIGRGYLYYVSLKGITGASHLQVDDVEDKLAQIRKQTEMPIAVGFGVKNAETAAKVSSIADGVIVGSVLVSKIEAAPDQPEVIQADIVQLLREMRLAMDLI